MNPSNPTPKIKLSRRARLQRDKVTDLPILLYPEGVLKLNQSSEAILGLCDGSRTVSEIAGLLAETYQAPRSKPIEADVSKLLERLWQLNLLATAPPPAEERHIPLPTNPLPLPNSPTPERSTVIDARRTQPNPQSAIRNPQFPAPRLFSILAELTYRCPLHCPYCSNPG